MPHVFFFYLADEYPKLWLKCILSQKGLIFTSSRCNFWIPCAQNLASTNFQSFTISRSEYIKEKPFTITSRINDSLRNIQSTKIGKSQELLGVKGSNFQNFLLFMILTHNSSLVRIWDLWVTRPGWFEVELPPFDMLKSGTSTDDIKLKLYR